MKLALIPPLSLLDNTFKTGYQLMLPQLAHEAEYDEIYRKHCNYNGDYVILDNGAAEGVPYHEADLVNMAIDFGVDELVIPDVIGDHAASMALSKAFLEVWHETLEDNGIKTMWVVQGSNLDEIVISADQAWMSGADAIGIPRHLPATMKDRFARINACNAISRDLEDFLPIHFLGGTSLWSAEAKFLADPLCTDQSFVRGMDTSMPYNYGYRGERVNDLTVRCDRPEGYFDLKQDDFDAYITEVNVGQMIEWTGATR